MYYGNPNIGAKVPNVLVNDTSTYIVTNAPSLLVVDLENVKDYLNITVTSFDTMLTVMINTSSIMFQDYTGRTLLNTDYSGYFTKLVQSYEIRRSKLQSISSFEYLNTDNDWVAFDSNNYRVTNENNYSRIILTNTIDLPDDQNDSYQSIRINFTAGYGDLQTDIPQDIVLALYSQIAQMFAYRGDCEPANVNEDIIKSLPSLTRNVYRKYRIPQLYGATYRGNV